MIEITVLDASRRAEAKAAWSALEAQMPERGLMCSWEWTGTWLEHYGDVVPHRFALGRKAGAPCGVALITAPIRTSRLRPPVAALGTTGEPPGCSVFIERNCLLAPRAEKAAFAAALIEMLEADGERWQRLRLDGMLIEEAELLLDGRTPMRWHVEESPVAELPAEDAGDVLESLPSSKRQRARRALRQFGELQTQWAADTAQAQHILQELIALHTARWQAEGKPGAFASARFRTFHQALIAKLLPAGRAALFRVQREGQTIGCLYGLADGKRMLFYQGGLRQFEDNRLRVGIAAHALFMQECCNRGFSKYDFLAPAARYKSDLSTCSERLVWAEVERPGARLLLERVARQVKRTRAI
jgi:CelD/BcsL family acetyltransferase involved in cellulose biosynthesis